MRPTVGRIVHYYPVDENVRMRNPRAAIITDTYAETTVDLTVFDHAVASFGVEWIRYSETPKAGHWSWPPRD